MSSDTLVLNKGFYAIHVIDWRRSLSLLYQGHAQAIDENLQSHNFDDWKELTKQRSTHPSGVIHTVNFEIAIPEVIRLTYYDRLPKSEVKFTRKNIYQNYNYKCCYCGKKFNTQDLNLDHVIPRSHGGTTDWNNIVTACLSCNSLKADKTPEEANMKLLVAPIKPRWKGSRSLLQFSLPIKESWQRLLDEKYWNSELQRD